MKLAALDISNFGCIGDAGYRVHIDDIVVLIGPNNVGKSLVLDAYEAFASSGSAQPLSRFRDQDASNTIEIAGIFIDLTSEDTDKIGTKWLHEDAEFGSCIKVMWRWSAPDIKGEKHSWDDSATAWVPKGVGGWDSLIASRIPVPLRVKPTDDPTTTEAKIVDILTATIKAGLKEDAAALADVKAELEKVAGKFEKLVKADIEETCSCIAKKLAQVFPGHEVEFRPSVGKFDADKIIGSGSHIRIKEPGRESVPLTQEGTGLQRAFLWSALGSLAELGRYKHGKKQISSEMPRLLLIDEPESFLHPPMVRKAREALYGVANVDGWQVIASTHSPVFIDVAKPHTTIVRLSKDEGETTHMYSSDQVAFDADERTVLRMIRSCHPTVNEFFFADHVYLVEGETEQVVLSVLLEKAELDGRHIVNCLGKANIPMFQRILNQFGTPYTVIHDSDAPNTLRGDKVVRNAMWTLNERIFEALEQRDSSLPKSSVITHVPDFERYYYGKSLTSDKPHAVLEQLRRSDFDTSDDLKKLRELASFLADGNHACVSSSMEDVKSRVATWVKNAALDGDEKWQL